MLPFRFPMPPIEQYESIDAVDEWVTSIARLSEHWFQCGGSFSVWLDNYQFARSDLFRRCWERFIPQDIRAHADYVLMGSAARREDLFTSDLDFAILHDHHLSFGDMYPHLQNFILAMSRFGVPPCQGFVMGTNRRWIGTIEDWYERVNGYFSFPDWENSRYLFMLVDSRANGARNEIWKELREHVFDRIRNSPFICWEMAHLGIHRTTAIDLRGFPKLKRLNHEIVFPVKEGMLNTMIHSIRLLSLDADCRVLPTMERLKCLGSVGMLEASVVQDLQQAIKFGWEVRAKQQLADVRSSDAAQDVVIWSKLNAEQQEAIKLHLRTTKSLERRVHRLFRKPG